MKGNITKYVCAVLIAALLSVVFIPFALANSKISDARYGVLRVLCDSRYGRATGTGFIIAQTGEKTYIVTNYHVVEDAPEYVFIIPENIRGDWLPANVEYHQNGLDIAILSVETGLEDRPVLPVVSTDTVNFADTVYAIGFPGAADEVIDDSNMLPSTANDVTITNGTVSNPSRKLDDGIFAIHSTAALTFGNSGGPLLNEDAQVVGVNTWIYSEGAYGISYSIHSDYIIDICTRLDIPYISELPSEIVETSEPSPDPVISGQDPVSPAHTGGSETADTASGNEIVSGNLGFIIIAGSLITLGLLVFFVIITQKGNMPAWLAAHKAAVGIITIGLCVALIVGVVLPLALAPRPSADDARISADMPPQQIESTPDTSPSQPESSPEIETSIPETPTPEIPTPRPPAPTVSPATPPPQVLPIAGSAITGTWEFVQGTWIWHFGLSDTIFFLSSGSVFSAENDTWADWYLIDEDTLWVVDWFGDEYLFNFTITDDILTIEDEDGDTSIYSSKQGDFSGNWEYSEGNWIWVFGYSWLVTFSDDEIYLSRSDTNVTWELSDTENDLFTVWDPEYSKYRDFRYCFIEDALMLVDEDEDWAIFIRS